MQQRDDVHDEKQMMKMNKKLASEKVDEEWIILIMKIQHLKLLAVNGKKELKTKHETTNINEQQQNNEYNKTQEINLKNKSFLIFWGF